VVPSRGRGTRAILKTAAVRVHALARALGVEKARVVGHDIGLMVAYADAAQFPAEVEKLVVMDAFLPGVAGWERVYDDPGLEEKPDEIIDALQQFLPDGVGRRSSGQ
jgi:pimeloyl-ACP methyl ester carboxylesterase